MTSTSDWPELPSWEEWGETLTTLHLWTQIVGKVRLVNTPWINHSWHVTLYTTPRGLTTGAIPSGPDTFQIDFDFLADELVVLTNHAGRGSVALEYRSVASLYEELRAVLDDLGVPTKIDRMPNELADAIRFDRDETHDTYDANHARTLWRALLHADRVLTRFRSRFLGKCSPVHFFWGSFDMAVTRFSGAAAPEHPGGFPGLNDIITREAYSHEVSSAGFWPGGRSGPAFFYSYAYPTPEGFSGASVGPADAAWSSDLGEFVLPYDAVRSAESPEDALMEFLQSTYEAAATAADWDREALEQSFVP